MKLFPLINNFFEADITNCDLIIGGYELWLSTSRSFSHAFHMQSFSHAYWNLTHGNWYIKFFPESFKITDEFFRADRVSMPTNLEVKDEDPEAQWIARPGNTRKLMTRLSTRCWRWVTNKTSISAPRRWSWCCISFLYFLFLILILLLLRFH